MVKPFRHPETLRILRQRSSHADVVSNFFPVGSLSPVTFPEISLSASRDEQEALETARGGALRWVSLIELFFLVHDPSRAINLTGIYRMRGDIR